MSDLGPVRFNMFQVLSQVRTLLATGGEVPLGQATNTPLANNTNLKNLGSPAGIRLPQMEAEQTTRMLKDALKWPDDIKEMLADFIGEEQGEAPQKGLKPSLKQLLQTLPEDGTIGLEVLADKLEKQTQSGMERLMKLVQGGAMAQGKAGVQVAELASSLGQLAEQVRTSPQQAAKLLILMALPLCPPPPPMELDVSWEEEGGGGEGTDEDDISMILYVQTNRLGRFKLALQQLKPLQILVTVHHEPAGKSVLEPLEEALNAHLAEEGLPASIFDAIEISSPLASASGEVGTGGFKGQTRQENRQDVQMQKGSRISVLVLDCAYFLSRTLFDFDTQSNLLSRS